MLIAGSRLPSEWLSGGTIEMSSANAYLEGSSLDRNIFLLLIVLGTVVLLSRSVPWMRLLAANPIVVTFFVFSLASLLWSDFAFTAFKRWYKVLGHVIMALVVLTDKDRDRAFMALFRRATYVLVPGSVLFIKYYPELGRGFNIWTGAATDVGITTDKNALGNLCLISGLFLLAAFMGSQQRKAALDRIDYYLSLFFLGLILWLLAGAQSSTALVSGVLGTITILSVRVGFVRRHFVAFALVGCAVFGALLTLTEFKTAALAGLGEDSTLTGRTDLWSDLVSIGTNPLVGAGFESFWLGDTLDHLWSKYWWRPNQAHNGYLETYLNLGLTGLMLQCGMMVSAFRGGMKCLAADADKHETAEQSIVAVFRVAFVLALAAFNVTDATFKAVHLSFFVFFMVALHVDAKRPLLEECKPLYHRRPPFRRSPTTRLGSRWITPVHDAKGTATRPRRTGTS
jgi:O-antigen ligase